MGVDAGFDMVPCLSRSVMDRQDWNRFIEVVKEHYRHDAQVESKPNFIEFKAGEHPVLPFECHKFLRFSSKISGSIATTTRVESYINTVTRMAKINFGSRVQYWNEGADQDGYYDWHEVHESIKSYAQLDKPGTHTTVAHLLSDVDPLHGDDIPLFKIKDIPGKGRGLVARLDISKGTRILCEKPLLIVRPVPPHELELNLASKLKALSKLEQRQFLSLYNNSPRKLPFSGIVKTNALPCGPGSRVGGVYATISLINHSCHPNSHHSWNSHKENENVHAIRTIKAGEEITISYNQDGPSNVRQAFLKESFGFDCTCTVCSLPPRELQASNARRIQIQNLDSAIGDPFGLASSPQESLDNCHSLLRLLAKEYDGCAEGLLARLYYDAFQISIAHGDQARASVFAERACQARTICEGEENPVTQKAKALALKPADHVSFELYSTRWRTTKEMLPKGLDATQFEKWLWRA